MSLCSSYEGWDNPFRPEGELSNDAEDILRLWKEGKLKDVSLLLKAKEESEKLKMADHEDQLDSQGQLEQPLLTSNGSTTSQNGVKNGTSTKNGGQKTITEHVKTSSAPGPLRSEKVTVMGGDEPKKKQGCCSLM